MTYRTVVDKLKARWGVGPWGMVAILAAFALAGSTVVRIGPLILNTILPEGVSRWIWWTARILLIVPLYQVLLLVYGTLLGQFSFFWKKEKAMVMWLGRALGRSR